MTDKPSRGGDAPHNVSEGRVGAERPGRPRVVDGRGDPTADNDTYPRFAVGAVALVAYVGCIVLANWAIGHFGFIWGPFGVVPAGTYFAGAVFLFRDVIQLTFGRWWVLPAIGAGALLSWWVSPSFAVASAVAFGCGELVDWAAFTPLIERGQVVAAFLLANTVGAAVDTLIFLQIAFGSTAHWQATTAAKVMVTLAFLPLRLMARQTVNRWAVAA